MFFNILNQPISAITLDEPNSSQVEKEPKLLTSSSSSQPRSPRITVRQRLSHALRRSPISNSTPDIPNEYSSKQHDVDEFMTTPSRLQVAVLIAMPSEYSLYEADSEGDSKGKRRDSSLHDDSIPDVIFGISSLPLESSISKTF